MITRSIFGVRSLAHSNFQARSTDPRARRGRAAVRSIEAIKPNSSSAFSSSPSTAASKVGSETRARVVSSAASLDNGDIFRAHDMHGMCVPSHDFCLTFPFGGMVALFGVAGYVMRRSMPSLISGVVIGGALIATGAASLRAWSTGAASFPWTASSAAVTGVLAYVMWKKFLVSHAMFPSGILAISSAIMLAFYAKNLFIDGGNPPKKPAKESAD